MTEQKKIKGSVQGSTQDSAQDQAQHPFPWHDENVSVQELKDAIARFCQARDWDQFHGAKDLAIGLITEAAELLEQFRFLTGEQIEERLRDPVRRERIEDELADSLFFILRFAGRNGVDLGRALARKLEKNARKYPVELARGSNKKYDEF